MLDSVTPEKTDHQVPPPPAIQSGKGRQLLNAMSVVVEDYFEV